MDVGIALFTGGVAALTAYGARLMAGGSSSPTVPAGGQGAAGNGNTALPVKGKGKDEENDTDSDEDDSDSPKPVKEEIRNPREYQGSDDPAEGLTRKEHEDFINLKDKEANGEHLSSAEKTRLDNLTNIDKAVRLGGNVTTLGDGAGRETKNSAIDKAREIADEKTRNEKNDSLTPIDAGGDKNRFFEQVFSVFRGDGLWNTKGEAALSRILNSDVDDFSKNIKIKVGDTTITRLAGEKEITVVLQGGEKFTLNDSKYLSKLIGNAGKEIIDAKGKIIPGLDINKAVSFNQLIDDGLYKYYSAFSTGGSDKAPEGYLNRRMNLKDVQEGHFNFYKYSKTTQITAANPITHLTDNEDPSKRTKLNYLDFTVNDSELRKKTLTSDPIGYMNNKKGVSPIDMFCEELGCRYAAKVMLLKSVGLLPPGATAMEVESMLKQDKQHLMLFSDQQMIDRAQNGDWAKLTGAYQVKNETFPFVANRAMVNLSNSEVQTHLNEGNVVVLNSQFQRINHVTVLRQINQGVAVFDDTLGSPLATNGLPVNSINAEVYGIKRSYQKK